MLVTVAASFPFVERLSGESESPEETDIIGMSLVLWGLYSGAETSCTSTNLSRSDLGLGTSAASNRHCRLAQHSASANISCNFLGQSATDPISFLSCGCQTANWPHPRVPVQNADSATSLACQLFARFSIHLLQASLS